MIEALKSDEIVEKVGGKFKLCSLIQRRLQQLLDGARPLVARDGMTDLELVIEEITQDKITLEYVEDQESSSAEPAQSEALL
jgi:DNA-directed RNA polymerase subunit omega